MEPQQTELTLEESIKQVMQTLPPVIRNYLAQGKYSVVAQNLMATYSLHIDQSGILEREIMLLLMGIENPTEFTEALVNEARIDKQTVSKIVQDVNEQVFIPLKEQEMKSKGTDTEEPAKLIAQNPSAILQSPVTDEKFLEDHEEPHIEINKIPNPLPKTAPPTPNLPGVIAPLPPPPPIPTPLKPLTLPLKPVTPPVPAKPYSVDPYREPLE